MKQRYEQCTFTVFNDKNEPELAIFMYAKEGFEPDLEYYVAAEKLVYDRIKHYELPTEGLTFDLGSEEITTVPHGFEYLGDGEFSEVLTSIV